MRAGPLNHLRIAKVTPFKQVAQHMAGVVRTSPAANEDRRASYDALMSASKSLDRVYNTFIGVGALGVAGAAFRHAVLTQPEVIQDLGNKFYLD